MTKRNQAPANTTTPGTSAEDSEQSEFGGESPIVTARVIPDEPKKKPRTESPETLAIRALRVRREIQSQQIAELTRHVERTKELQVKLEKHDEACEQLPAPAREILVKLRGDL
jgi:hypothetical protein